MNNRFVFRESDNPGLGVYKDARKGRKIKKLSEIRDRLKAAHSSRNADGDPQDKKDIVAATMQSASLDNILESALREVRIAYHPKSLETQVFKCVQETKLTNRMAELTRPFRSVVMSDTKFIEVAVWDGEYYYYAQFRSRDTFPVAIIAKPPLYDQDDSNVLFLNHTVIIHDMFLVEVQPTGNRLITEDLAFSNLCRDAHLTFGQEMIKQMIPTEKITVAPKRKTKLLGKRYVNKSHVRIDIIDSDYFREIIVGDGFKVRGHWRLQPYGPKADPSYKLIWIHEYEKTGYRRRLTKTGIIK